MFHRRLFASLVALSLFATLTLVVGCGSKGDESQTLATIGDRTVDTQYYQDRLARMQENQLRATTTAICSTPVLSRVNVPSSTSSSTRS